MCMKALRPIAAAVFVTVSACSGVEKQAAPADMKHVDPATAGTVTGRVTFVGTPPENPPMRIAGDPKCPTAAGMTVENYLVKDGGLDNVFVYVKDGLGNYHFDAPAEPATLDQQGCRYVPHVIGLQVGQPLEVTNRDATLHNVHALPDVNREFNFPQHARDQRDTRTFTAAEVMVPLKCDLHPWMKAYVGVVAHPYYAVTKDGGRFELKNLPPGVYTIDAWHAKAGTTTQQVTIGEKETKDVTFTFRSAAATSANSIRP
jgi:plastocyanin